MNQVEALHPASARRDLPPFRPGDTVRVHVLAAAGHMVHMEKAPEVNALIREFIAD